MTAEFDAFEDSYVDDLDDAAGFSGKSGEFFARRKADLLIDLARRRLGDPGALEMLDVGCGVGLTDQFLTPHLGSLSGVDVSAAALVRARELNPDAHYAESTIGEPLPFAEGSFDVSFAICVMHHVPPPDWAGFLAEMKRVVRPGGLVTIFEHNPWNPGTRKIVRDCVFDEDVDLIREGRMRSLLSTAGMTLAESRQIIFLPTEAAWWLRIERRLSRVPMGAQYYTAGRVSPG